MISGNLIKWLLVWFHITKSFMLMSPNNMIMNLLLNTPFKNHLPVTIIITAIVYAFNYLFTVLWVFFPNKWKKMNTVSQTESRTLLQHHSFKNSITLHPAWTRGVKSKLRKLSSVLEFVTCQRLQPHFSVILFFLRVAKDFVSFFTFHFDLFIWVLIWTKTACLL